jgi:hypothetical protein
MNWISSGGTENPETSKESTMTCKEPSPDEERSSRADAAGESGVSKQSIKRNV